MKNQNLGIYTKIKWLIETNKVIYVSGKAGTGKSTLIEYINNEYINTSVVLAPTGLAAININGQTIHSFFNFPFNLIDKKEVRKQLQEKNKEIIKQLKVLIIDEVSMVTPNIIDEIDKIMRKIRDVDEPFGNCSILLVGDLLQLPPIVIGKKDKTFFKEKYSSKYFFSAKIFSKKKIKLIELKKTYRQTDKEFIEILDNIRVNKNHREGIRLLNNKCYLDKIKIKNNYVTLVTTNDISKKINEKRLDLLSTPLKKYYALIGGIFLQKKIKFPSPEVLELKIGAQIIFNSNSKFWVNGSTGEIVGLFDNYIKVKLSSNNQIVSVNKKRWQSMKKIYKNKKLVEEIEEGFFEQYPLILGWSITIHKSQGMTLDNINIDLGKGAFEFGQTYVALSRCKNIEGIKLINPISMKDVLVDPIILKFYNID